MKSTREWLDSEGSTIPRILVLDAEKHRIAGILVEINTHDRLIVLENSFLLTSSGSGWENYGGPFGTRHYFIMDHFRSWYEPNILFYLKFFRKLKAEKEYDQKFLNSESFSAYCEELIKYVADVQK